MADDSPSDEGYWFPAKRYGWGWGPPRRWQGWIVVFLFVAAIGGWMIFATIDPARRLPFTPVVLPILITALIAICWWKGEPPRWRWGG